MAVLQRLVFCLCGLAWLGTAAGAEPIVPIYEVDFGSPPHVVGEPPVLGEGPLPRDTPTSSVNGPPEVVERHAGLERQPVVLETDGLVNINANERLELDIPVGYREMDRLIVAFDMVAGDIRRSFDVFVDAPAIHKTSWDDEETVLAGAPQPGQPFSQQEIGGYEQSTVQRVRIELDLANGAWSVRIDEELRFLQPTSATFVDQVRFSLNTSRDQGIVGLDDVRIHAVPRVRPRVDVRPGQEVARIRPLRPGVIPVAVYGSNTFPVDRIDLSSLAFGPDRALRTGAGLRFEDLDGDGFFDIVADFPTRETGIALGDVEACLTGEFRDVDVAQTTRPFGGCDAIVTLDGCGLGFELALVLPLLLRLYRRGRPRIH